MIIISFNDIKMVFCFASAIVGVVFLVPLPKGWKAAMLEFVEKSQEVRLVLKYHTVAVVLIAIHWVYSISISVELQEMHEIEKNIRFNSVSSRDLYILAQKFEAEGDIYLNATLLIISIFLNRLIALQQFYYLIKCKEEQINSVDLSHPLDDVVQQVTSQFQNK